MSPSRVLASLVVVLASAAAATGFALARQPDYRAAVDVVAVERETLRPSIDPAYLRGRFAAGRAELATRLERSGVDPALLRGVRIRRTATPPGAVSISSAAATPARAEMLTRLVVLQIDALSAVELGRVARRRLRAGEARLASPSLAAGERQRLQRRLSGLRRYLEQPRARFGALAGSVERPRRWADRLAQAAPGALPARPSPIWAGLMAALVGAAIVGTAGLLRRRRWAA